MVSIPDADRDLFESTAFLTVVTLNPDGSPHPTPVWVDYDDGTGTAPWSGDRAAILVNTTDARRKYHNVTRDPRVGGSVFDPEDPYRYRSFTGRVVETTTEGADAHIDALAERYMGVGSYPNRDDEDGHRVILRIEPTALF